MSPSKTTLERLVAQSEKSALVRGSPIQRGATLDCGMNAAREAARHGEGVKCHLYTHFADSRARTLNIDVSCTDLERELNEIDFD